MLNHVILDAHEFDIKKTVAINVSPQCLMVETFSGEVEKILNRHNRDGSKICFEVTESTILIQSPIVEKNLEHLAKLGIKLSIDDFGTGHSSISLLQNLRFSELKMDRLFINQISLDPFSKAAIESTLLVANSLRVDLCIEGVETEIERDWLISKGCLIGQGYFYSKPLPPQEVFNTSEHSLACSDKAVIR
jgi:EAL domain-containing protein (putative c-di-GMP-specific phosphodiesterase class I)